LLNLDRFSVNDLGAGRAALDLCGFEPFQASR
jgi:hypothetical protein